MSRRGYSLRLTELPRLRTADDYMADARMTELVGENYFRWMASAANFAGLGDTEAEARERLRRKIARQLDYNSNRFDKEKSNAR